MLIFIQSINKVYTIEVEPKQKPALKQELALIKSIVPVPVLTRDGEKTVYRAESVLDIYQLLQQLRNKHIIHWFNGQERGGG